MNKWQIQFDTAFGGPHLPVYANNLQDWTTMSNDSIKYYSGSAIYTGTFYFSDTMHNASLVFEGINNMANIKVNGVDCGTIWTKPYEVNIAKALKIGENVITIEVANTWANRLIGDHLLPAEKRITWTTAPFRLKDKPLLPAGITGDVKLVFE